MKSTLKKQKNLIKNKTSEKNNTEKQLITE